ncbi:MAG: hypothetical protein HY865_21570 [Chloroflexi bacterium]|nr:hypothetical protein [Chloroflexota bacterium]
MKQYLSLLFFAFTLGCSHVSSPANPTSSVITGTAAVETAVATTVTSKIPSTPQPPLKAHEWTPETVLLRLDFTHGDNGGILAPPDPPHFILYSDGNLLLQYPLLAGMPHGDWQLLHKKLERGEMCRVLNTLDQAGFLDYNPSNYKVDVKDARGAYIEVNAWESHKGEYPFLPEYIVEALSGQSAPTLSEVAEAPVISPALREAYYLLGDYPESGSEVYQPEKLIVWVVSLDPQSHPDAQWQDWRFSGLTLAWMFSRIELKDDGFIILEGAAAKSLYEYLDESFSTHFYIETGKSGEKGYYAFYARPLLPYELPNDDRLMIPDPALAKTSEVKLKCLPSDGVMPTPAHNLIFSIP